MTLGTLGLYSGYSDSDKKPFNIDIACVSIIYYLKYMTG